MKKNGPQKKSALIFSICAAFVLLFCIFPRFSESGTSIHKRFVYYIFWSGIRAGKAVLDFKSTPDGATISTRATSATFISLFYKVDDRAISTLHPDGYPREFVLKVHEGLHRRHKITRFEKPGQDKPQKVIFNNVLNNEIIEFNLDKPAYDPLSGFLAMTKRDLIPGQSEYIDVFDNKKLWQTEVKVLRKEKVRVIAGEFDTILVKPLLKSEGLFQKTGEMHLWVTDDDRKLPVRFESKAIIGKFTVMLAGEDF